MCRLELMLQESENLFLVHHSSRIHVVWTRTLGQLDPRTFLLKHAPSQEPAACICNTHPISSLASDDFQASLDEGQRLHSKCATGLQPHISTSWTRHRSQLGISNNVGKNSQFLLFLFIWHFDWCSVSGTSSLYLQWTRDLATRTRRLPISGRRTATALEERDKASNLFILTIVGRVSRQVYTGQAGLISQGNIQRIRICKTRLILWPIPADDSKRAWYQSNVVALTWAYPANLS
ncbi:hypothetical protein PGT21_016883 [Puccinia graminis f. sp. tritici]|uniref:Uncharacterized protein n=1 Tax=Puccinia graminis f. sp. tritici TaxID=56615 RepID=A0A5B0QN49_PUCGR|nr:hypothetical protein PGT21_016883 [Puccinia graminis f. sp. tritici]